MYNYFFGIVGKQWHWLTFFFPVTRMPMDITVPPSTSCPRSVPISSLIALFLTCSSQPSPITWWVFNTLTHSHPNEHTIITIHHYPSMTYSHIVVCISIALGLKPAFLDFLCFTLTMTLTSIGAVSVAFMVSATVSSLAMANLLVALPFVIMMVSQTKWCALTH